MKRSLWPGDLLQLQDRMFGLDPGLYVVTDFPFGMVELRATWRNEDGLLSPTATAHRLTYDELGNRLFRRIGMNLYRDEDLRSL